MISIKISALWRLFCFLVISGVPLSGLTQAPNEAPRGGEFRIGVASNFIEPAKEIIDAFDYPQRINLLPGSSGKIAAQIANGAPIDVFLSADYDRPAWLEQAGHARNGTRFTYAEGELVLWSAHPFTRESIGTILRQNSGSQIAIANPKLAPYGRAAVETLASTNVTGLYQGKNLILGESINQVFQYVWSGQVTLALIARSQTHHFPMHFAAHWRSIPAELHTPIEQQAIAISDHPGGLAFLDFLKSRRAKDIMIQYGYRVPKRAAQDSQRPPNALPE